VLSVGGEEQSVHFNHTGGSDRPNAGLWITANTAGRPPASAAQDPGRGGGLALVLGCRTSLAGLVAAANMVVAARKVHSPQGFYGQGGWEFPGLIGLTALTLAITGPGAISLDKIRKG
jgi:putative oxidoreductase